MRRREFITFVGGAASWPLAALAQQAEPVRRVGVLFGLEPDDAEAQARTTVRVVCCSDAAIKLPGLKIIA